MRPKRAHEQALSLIHDRHGHNPEEETQILQSFPPAKVARSTYGYHKRKVTPVANDPYNLPDEFLVGQLY